jgi:hypothetical protein
MCKSTVQRWWEGADSAYTLWIFRHLQVCRHHYLPPLSLASFATGCRGFNIKGHSMAKFWGCAAVFRGRHILAWGCSMSSHMVFSLECVVQLVDSYVVNSITDLALWSGQVNVQCNTEDVEADGEEGNFTSAGYGVKESNAIYSQPVGCSFAFTHKQL